MVNVTFEPGRNYPEKSKIYQRLQSALSIHLENRNMDVLLVEDDAAIAASIVDGLSDVAISAVHVQNGGTALAQLGTHPYDCVLLDLGLPDIDGMDVCRTIRAESQVPIIIVSARDTEFDRVLALEIGADDYLVKPFGMRELIARIRAVRRRHEFTEEPALTVTVVGDLEIDTRTQHVKVRGTSVHLTPKEFAILAYLAQDPGAVYRRSEIVRDIWDTNWVGGSKSLDAHLAAIRKKLGSSEFIQAVHGVGYRLRTA